MHLRGKFTGGHSSTLYQHTECEFTAKTTEVRSEVTWHMDGPGLWICMLKHRMIFLLCTDLCQRKIKKDSRLLTKYEETNWAGHMWTSSTKLINNALNQLSKPEIKKRQSTKHLIINWEKLFAALFYQMNTSLLTDTIRFSLTAHHCSANGLNSTTMLIFMITG